MAAFIPNHFSFLSLFSRSVLISEFNKSNYKQNKLVTSGLSDGFKAK